MTVSPRVSLDIIEAINKMCDVSSHTRDTCHDTQAGRGLGVHNRRPATTQDTESCCYAGKWCQSSES